MAVCQVIGKRVKSLSPGTSGKGVSFCSYMGRIVKSTSSHLPRGLVYLLYTRSLVRE